MFLLERQSNSEAILEAQSASVNKNYFRLCLQTTLERSFSAIKHIMVYSVHGHISYIFEANAKRPNDFSLIRRKPN